MTYSTLSLDPILSLQGSWKFQFLMLEEHEDGVDDDLEVWEQNADEDEDVTMLITHDEDDDDNDDHDRKYDYFQC